MSGIFGAFTKQSKDAVNIEKALLWNQAYGKDAKDTYSNNPIHIGCCYDALSVYASKDFPVLHSGSSVAVIDALLYNHPEIASKCEMTEPLSDENLLFAFIERFGMNSLKDINGDFSGAIYNCQSNTLTLFRDHMGIRPLFYYADEHLVAFSTDIRGLLSIEGVDASVNEDWIYRTCAGSYLDGVTATEYKNIFCIPPASYMTFSFSQNTINIQTHSYWQLGSKKLRLSSFEEYKDMLRHLVTDSVKRRLDVIPGLVGAELSGGLDSGVIDILISRLGRDCVHFSWSVDPSEVPYAPNDERLVIADICKQEGITCKFSKMSNARETDSNFNNSMESLGFILDADEPLAFRYALPPYINALTLCDTSEYIERSGAKVVFTGHGGDEGISHRCNPYELFYHHEYYHYLKYFWSTTRGQKIRILRTLKTCFKELHSSRKYYSTPFHMPFGAPELLNPDFARKFNGKDMPLLHFAYDPIQYIHEGGSRNRLDNVALLGAYSGVRYLIPYLDYRVIDFAVSIPRHLYLNGTQNRYLFREAFKDIMPPSLYSLQYKEDNSHKNYVKNPDWYEEFSKIKNAVYQKLDRNYWKSYLNFDTIDAWMQQGKPAETERQKDSNKLSCLFYCAMTTNLAEKANQVSYSPKS